LLNSKLLVLKKLVLHPGDRSIGRRVRANALSVVEQASAQAHHLRRGLGMFNQADRLRPDAPENQVAPPAVSPAEGAGAHGTVARNAFNLMLGQVTTTVLGVLFSAALGRMLGATEYGLYFLIASFGGFAYVIADWGQYLHITSEVARQPERSSLLLGTSLVLRAAGGALVIIPSWVAAWAFGYDATTCWYVVAFIAVSVPLFLAQSYGIVFRARDKMGLDAWVSVANKTALLGFALPALALGNGLPGVLAAQALAGLFALALAMRLYARVTTGPLRFSHDIAVKILAGGGSIFTASLATTSQSYIDAVMLSRLAPPEVIGWYGAAATILGTIVAPGLIICYASLPRLSRAAASSSLFKVEAKAALRPILWLGALGSVGTFLFAKDAVAIVYGQHFGPSAIIMKVFAFGFPLVFMNMLFFVILFALGRAKSMSVVKAAGVVLTTALELLLIPIFQERAGNGAIGLVTAALVSEFVVFAGAIFLLRREVFGLDIWVDIAKALGSAALTLLLLLWMPPLPFLVGVPVCATVFLLSSIGLGLVRRDDIRLFRTLLRKD
jgi:O-antigen/teichoic acid export membrane protein